MNDITRRAVITRIGLTAAGVVGLLAVPFSKTSIADKTSNSNDFDVNALNKVAKDAFYKKATILRDIPFDRVFSIPTRFIEIPVYGYGKGNSYSIVLEAEGFIAAVYATRMGLKYAGHTIAKGLGEGAGQALNEHIERITSASTGTRTIIAWRQYPTLLIDHVERDIYDVRLSLRCAVGCA